MRAKFKRIELNIAHLAIVAAGLLVLVFSGQAHAQPAPALQDVARLRASVERFAGAPARIDAQLVVARCPSPALSWARADVVRADCADPVWTLYMPVAASPTSAAPTTRAKPAIRRGERVSVEAGGPGFVIIMDAEAERDADGSKIALKTASGRRFTGRIGADGKILLARP